MIDAEIKKCIFHDYREDVFNSRNKRGRLRKKYWDEFVFAKSKWFEETNYLKRTLIYALTHSCCDVEYISSVKDTYSSYCSDYLSNYPRADIMNGWWFCFKTIYSRKKTVTRKSFLEEYRFDCKKGYQKTLNDIDEITGFIANQKEYKTLCSFLAIVYSAGNMTPSLHNPPEQLGAWEYKVNRYTQNDNDLKKIKQKLLFMDYDSDPVYDKDDLSGYMESRIEKILKRSYRIATKAYKGDITNELYTELRSNLDEYIQNLEES